MEEFSFDDILRTLQMQWKLIGALTLVACLLAGGATYFLIPQKWTAHTSILLESSRPEIPSALAEVQSLLGGAGGLVAHDHFEMILRSRTIMKQVVEEFDLVELLEAESIWHAITGLRKRCRIDSDSPRCLVLAVTWAGPPRGRASEAEKTSAAKMAADLANSLISHLQTYLTEAEYTRASKHRKFLEGQLATAEQEERALEDALVEYATTHDIIQPSAQASAVIRQVEQLRTDEAKLLAQLSGARKSEREALERLDTQERMAVSSVSEERNPRVDDLHSQILTVQRQIAEQTEVEGKSSHHPDVQRLQTELDEAKAQLAEQLSQEMLTKRRDMSVDPCYTSLVTTALTKSLERADLEARLEVVRAEKDQVLAELSAFPSLSQQYERLARQLRLKAEAVARLTEQYEAARIAEAASLDYVSVLDEAVPPYKASAPSIRRNVAAVGAITLVLSTLLAFYRQGRINSSLGTSSQEQEAPLIDQEA